jgi:DNA-binding transcriptional regulator YiaG
MKLSSTDIIKMRKSTGLTQEAFAKAYHIPYMTLTCWEQGLRSPNETSMVYLKLIQDEPEGMAKKVGKLDRVVRRRKFEEAA